jgi:hypothetical protein
LLLGGGFLLAVGAAIAIGLLEWDTFAGGFLVVGVLLSFAAVACFHLIELAAKHDLRAWSKFLPIFGDWLDERGEPEAMVCRARWNG